MPASTDFAKCNRNRPCFAHPQLLRKYIGYARTYVAPRLTEEAGEVLRAFYLDLRRQSAVADGLPVTVRPTAHPLVCRNDGRQHDGQPACA